MADVFLSYATANREFVNRIRYFLEQRKYSTWMDHRQIKPGDDWEEEIESNLQRCKVFIVTVTEESNKSRWVKRECFLAESLGKATIPILRNGKLPFRLMDLQFVDFQENELPFDYSFRLLLEVLKQHIPDPSLESRPRHQPQVARQVPNYHIDKIQTRMYPEPILVQQDCVNHAKCLPRSKENQPMEEITMENFKPIQYRNYEKLENFQTVLADVNEVRRQVDELIRQIELAVTTEDYIKAKMLQNDLNTLEATIHTIESSSSSTSSSSSSSSSSAASVLDLNDADLLETRASLEAKLHQSTEVSNYTGGIKVRLVPDSSDVILFVRLVFFVRALVYFLFSGGCQGRAN